MGSGPQCKTVTGELTTDFGGARISGRARGGPPHRISGCLVDAHKTLLSLSKCTPLGRWLAQQRWRLTKGGGYMVLEDSTLSHKIRSSIDKEIAKPRSGVVESYEKNGVYNFFVEMRWQDQTLRCSKMGTGTHTRLIRCAKLEHS